MEINHTIRKKFIMVSIVIGTLLIGIQTFFFQEILKSIHDSDVQYSEGIIAQMNLAINKSFQNIRSIAYQLSLGSNIENYLLPENDFALYQDHQYFKQSINTMILCDEHILDIALYRADSRIMYHYLKDDTELNQVLAYNRSYFEGEEQTPSFRVIYNEEKTVSYIVYVQPVKFLSRATTYWKEQIGCLLIFVDDNLINDILAEHDTDILSGVYLMDSQDVIVDGIGKWIDDMEKKQLEIQPIAETGWKIGYSLNDHTLFQRYNTLRYMVATSIMIAALLFFVLFFVYNHYIVRPVSNLHRQIGFVMSGGLNKRISVERKDEIGSIAKVINTMLDHQKEILLEAAQLDGCGNIQFFTKIVVPLSKTIIAVIVLYIAVWQWNSYFNALIYTTNRKLQPLQLVLRNLLIQGQNLNIGEEMDAASIKYMMEIANLIKYGVIVVAIVPMLCFYPFLQKYFEKGVLIGSVKG